MQGKAVLIIGASGGLGRSVGKRFAQAGANLIVVSRTKADLQAASEEMTNHGAHGILAVPADVTEEEEIAKVSKMAHEAFGEIDVVVNTLGQSLIRDDLSQVTIDDWEEIMDSNLRSVFLSMREFLPRMMRRGSGCMINVSSRVGLFPVSMASVYAAAKAGVIALTRGWAGEAAKHGVRLMAIAPGPMDTPMRWAATPDFQRECTLNPDVLADFIVWVSSHPEVMLEDTLVPKALSYWP